MFIHKELLLGFKTATSSETPVHLLHIQEAEEHGIDIPFYQITQILRRERELLLKQPDLSEVAEHTCSTMLYIITQRIHSVPYNRNTDQYSNWQLRNSEFSRIV